MIDKKQQTIDQTPMPFTQRFARYSTTRSTSEPTEPVESESSGILTHTGSSKIVPPPAVNDLPNGTLSIVSGSSAVRRKLAFLKARVFLLSFVSYAVRSGTRSAFGITTAALHPDNEKDPSAPGYAPFNDEEWGSTVLGACDTTFLTAYAIGLFMGSVGARRHIVRGCHHRTTAASLLIDADFRRTSCCG